jgi:hypothetical protein
LRDWQQPSSSTRASGSDARALGAPVELNDTDVATAWAAGMLLMRRLIAIPAGSVAHEHI